MGLHFYGYQIKIYLRQGEKWHKKIVVVHGMNLSMYDMALDMLSAYGF